MDDYGSEVRVAAKEAGGLWTLRAIARVVGVAESTVSRWPDRPRPAIQLAESDQALFTGMDVLAWLEAIERFEAATAMTTAINRERAEPDPLPDDVAEIVAKLVRGDVLG